MMEAASAGSGPFLEIQLERESKIYYPGETVKGTAVLKVPTATACFGGVFLDFQAKATTEWIKGDDGDETKKCFSGETVFQHQIKTLVGCSYQTGSLRTTGQKEGTNFLGEAIDFDKIPGAGDIHIPCNESATKNMKLKVEANGADTIIDIPKLVAESGVQSYYLTGLVGKMQKGSINVSAEFVDYEDVFPNDENCSKHELCLVLRVHRLRGVKKGTKNVNVQIHNWTGVPEARPDRETLNRVELEVGVKSFPFSFKLRDDAPGSANWKIGTDSASMSYTLKAYVDIDKKEGVGGIQFTVIANRPLPRPSLLSPYKMETGDQPLRKSGFGCCRPSATVYTVSINMQIARLAYAPGEVVDITGSSVVNNSTQPQRAQIVLRSYLQQDGDYNQKHSLIHQDHVLFETEIPEKQTVILTNLREFESFRVPAVYPSYSGVYLDVDKTKRLAACIKWAYTLEIRLPNWGSGFYCRTPLLISAAPPFTSQLQQYRKVKSDPELTGQYSIFEHAVSGIHNSCETAPTLSSLIGDKGRKVLAKDASIPVWMGGRNDYMTWMKEDENRARLKEWMDSGCDKDFPDLVKLFYRNIVNVYAGPSGKFDENLD